MRISLRSVKAQATGVRLGFLLIENVENLNYRMMKKLEDYTQKEKQWFDEMHAVLTEYNARLGTKKELPMPDYTDHQMAEYSGYRQKVIAKECEED